MVVVHPSGLAAGRGGTRASGLGGGGTGSVWLDALPGRLDVFLRGIEEAAEVQVDIVGAAAVLERLVDLVHVVGTEGVGRDVVEAQHQFVIVSAAECLTGGKPFQVAFGEFGGGEALCGIKTAVFTLKWGGWDLNPRPEDYESSALTG